MKNTGLVAAAILISGSLLLTSCTSGDKVDVGDGGTAPNGLSKQNPDALPDTFTNAGGAKDWNTDGSTQAPDSIAVITDSPIVLDSSTDIEPTPVPKPTGAQTDVKPAEGGDSVVTLPNAKVLEAPSDVPTELKVSEAFEVHASGFKDKTIVYVHLYYSGADGNGKTITSATAKDDGTVVASGYIPAGFSTNSNYIIRVAGVNNDVAGIFYQTPIRIVE